MTYPKTVFGVNQRGDYRWAAWTARVYENGSVDSFQQLSDHDKEDQAHDAANAARIKYLADQPS